jgi:hypothetical protein
MALYISTMQLKAIWIALRSVVGGVDFYVLNLPASLNFPMCMAQHENESDSLGRVTTQNWRFAPIKMQDVDVQNFSGKRTNGRVRKKQPIRGARNTLCNSPHGIRATRGGMFSPRNFCGTKCGRRSSCLRFPHIAEIFQRNPSYSCYPTTYE